MTLALRQVQVRLGRNLVLQDVSLDVHPGRVLAIVGENGAGKSTALRTMAGEIRPQSGSTVLDDRNLSKWSPIEAALRRSIVPQHAHLTFGFKVLDVVLLGRYAHHRGHPQDEDRRFAQMALSRVAMGAMAHRSYTQLSGGERQRVQVARAMAQLLGSSITRYWLLDEPTASLDVAHQHVVLQLAREMASDGIGVAVVLHDLNLACRYADDVAVFKDGRILATGPIAKLTEGDLVENAFGVPVRYASLPNRTLPLIVVEPHASSTQQLNDGENHGARNRSYS